MWKRVSVLGSDKVAVLNENSLDYKILNSESEAVIFLNSTDATPSTPLRSIPIRTERVIQSLAIATTKLCNLRCSYCYAQHNNNYDCEPVTSTQMSLEDAVAGISKYLPPSTKFTPSVSFIGGEPLMNVPLLVGVNDWMKTNGYDKFSIGITTNGTRLMKRMSEVGCPQFGDMRVFEWLSANRFGTKISLDGTKEQHNANRIYSNGEGSFDTIMENLNDMLAIEPKFAKNITFRATALMGAGSENNIRDTLSFFDGLFSLGIGRNVFIATASPTCASEEDRKACIDMVRKQHLAAAEWYILSVLEGKHPSWDDTLHRQLYSLLYKGKKQAGCGAGSGYATIGFDGELFACHRITGSKIGTVEGGISPELRSKWLNKGVNANEKCQTCAYRYICGGGCPQHSLMVTGYTTIPDDLFCAEVEIKVETALRIISSLGEARCKELIPERKRVSKIAPTKVI